MSVILNGCNLRNVILQSDEGPLPPPDPYFSNVFLLLHGSSIDLSGFIVDSSSYNRAVIRTNPGSYISTSTFKWGPGSLAFDSGINPGFKFSTGSAPAPNFVPGLGDFTIESWVFISPVTMMDGSAFVSIVQSSGTNDFYFSKYPGTTELYVQGPSISITTGLNPSLTANAWHFISWSRVSGISYFHIDGILVYSIADTNNYSSPTNSTNIGPDLGTNEQFWLDDVRITNFVGRYNGSNYIVPTGPFPDY